MNWFRVAQQNELGEKIKHKIKSSPFFIALFKRYNVPIEKIDTDLTVLSKKLDGAFCEANDRQIIVDERLAGSADLLGRDFHFIAHELLHWLRRQREKISYFGDPEEIEGFTIAIAYALNELGTSPRSEQIIVDQFLPLIHINIKDDNTARKFLKHRIVEAMDLLAEIGN